jgi:hypothetical protein
LATRTASSIAADANDADDGAEAFLAIDAHGWRHAVEHGRIDDGAPDAAAGGKHRALADRIADELLEALRRVGIDQRAERRVALARIARRRGSLPLPPVPRRSGRRSVSSTTMRSVDMQIWPWFM